MSEWEKHLKIMEKAPSYPLCYRSNRAFYSLSFTSTPTIYIKLRVADIEVLRIQFLLRES